MATKMPRAWLAIALGVFAGNAGAQTLTLDNFESALRIVQPNSTDNGKYLWAPYDGEGAAKASVSTEDKHDGSASLKTVLSSGQLQLSFYPYTEALSGWSDGWQFMRKFVQNPSSYPMNKINRMRFWIKVPPGAPYLTDGTGNMEFGTYIRCSTCTDAESGGGHYYHEFALSSTGQWEQVIIDTHPDHSRGADGNLEEPDRLHPTGESSYTYFDLMDRFYIHFPYQKFTYPATFFVDGVELYSETYPENVDQIRALHAVYIPSTNEIRVGWTRKKNEDSVKHEVRYSFSDIHASGWAAATAAPSGTLTPPNSGGYNGMAYHTTGINMSGKSVVYIAIKPQNSDLFRQIAVPVSATTAKQPMPPSNVTAK